MDFRRFAIAGAAIIAAGCDHSASLTKDSEPVGKAPVAGEPRVVVAVIDSGINPYHSYFNASQPGLESPIYPPGLSPSAVTPEVLAEFGINEDHILTLTRTGFPLKDYDADAEQWAKVKPGEPYWFRGTNIIAIGRDTAGKLILPDDDFGDSHGVATSAAVLSANPEAILFFVEVFNRELTANDFGSAASEAFGFLHPAVDIVSTSYGLAEPVLGAALVPAPKAAYHSFTSAVRLGKLHFSSAGNQDACPTFLSGHAGPWWSIGVSSFYEDERHINEGNGRNTFACYFSDFVADSLQSLPQCALCQSGTQDVFGATSISVAVAAGVASKVLLDLRRLLAHEGGIRVRDGVPVMAQSADRTVSNWQVRRALEQAAYVPVTADWQPLPPHPDTSPVNDATPWLQVGWGLLTADPEKGVVNEALARLGFGTRGREKESGFCDFQTKLIEARHAYWDNVSPVVDAAVPDTDLYGGGAAEPLDHDPFIYCGSALPPLPGN